MRVHSWRDFKLLNPDKTVRIPDSVPAARCVEHHGSGCAAFDAFFSWRAFGAMSPSADVKAEVRHLLTLIQRG